VLNTELRIPVMQLRSVLIAAVTAGGVDDIPSSSELQ